SISNASSARYVVGNLQKAFNTGSGQSFTFPIGSSVAYTPLALASLNVSTGGNLTASTTSSEHPNISTSGIDSSKSVNRYWTLTDGGGIVASTYAGTFSFIGSDVDGGANT